MERMVQIDHRIKLQQLLYVSDRMPYSESSYEVGVCMNEYCTSVESI